MSIYNYGKKLISERHICLQSSWKTRCELKIWTPELFESIVFIKANKSDYESVLHFFWTTLFYLRETKSESEVEEVFKNTKLIKSNLKQAQEIIAGCNSKWYDDHQSLIPEAKWTHIIWQEENDVFISFEDEEHYYAYNWEMNSG